MKKVFLLALILAVFIGTTPLPAASQIFTITGQVLEEGSNTPIEGIRVDALIFFEPPFNIWFPIDTQFTDQGGHYTFSGPPITDYRFRFSDTADPKQYKGEFYSDLFGLMDTVPMLIDQDTVLDTVYLAFWEKPLISKDPVGDIPSGGQTFDLNISVYNGQAVTRAFMVEVVLIKPDETNADHRIPISLEKELLIVDPGKPGMITYPGMVVGPDNASGPYEVLANYYEVPLASAQVVMNAEADLAALENDLRTLEMRQAFLNGRFDVRTTVDRMKVPERYKELQEDIVWALGLVIDRKQGPEYNRNKEDILAIQTALSALRAEISSSQEAIDLALGLNPLGADKMSFQNLP